MERGYTIQELADKCNIQPETILKWVETKRTTWSGRPMPQYRKAKNGDILFDEAESDIFSSFVRNNVKKKNLGYELRNCKCPFCEKIFQKKIPAGSFAKSVKYCRIYCTEHTRLRYIPEDTQDFAYQL